MSGDNPALLRRLLIKGVGENDAPTIAELISPGYEHRNAPVPIRGVEGFRQLAAMYHTAFPDLVVVVEDVVAERDKVGSRGTITGTHGGDFMGIPATGKPVNVAYLDLWRVERGKFVETWMQMDMLGLMQQIGALPSGAR